jgi:predicted dehydrogenase
MESGKHVYSAVPIISIPDGDETLEWCDRIINVSRRTGQRYMLGETTYFHPETMFCRKKAQEGSFGDFVYAEGEYFHDVDSGCSLREVVRKRTSSSSGKEWLDNKRKYLEKGIKTGPMHYPTHSTSGPVAVMETHAVKVSASGYRNRNNDLFFEDYAFSNEVALFQMSNGASVRIIEFREIAGSIADSETFRIFGTKGSYAENKWMDNGRVAPPAPKALEKTEMTDEEMRDTLPVEVVEVFKKAMNKDSENLQDIDFVPRGHKGSHPYLVHEFVDAVASNRQPAINAWEAARYMAMGVMAHKSALKDGEILDVPDWGEAPV